MAAIAETAGNNQGKFKFCGGDFTVKYRYGQLIHNLDNVYRSFSCPSNEVRSYQSEFLTFEPSRVGTLKFPYHVQAVDSLQRCVSGVINDKAYDSLQGTISEAMDAQSALPQYLGTQIRTVDGARKSYNYAEWIHGINQDGQTAGLLVFTDVFFVKGASYVPLYRADSNSYVQMTVEEKRKGEQEYIVLIRQPIEDGESGPIQMNEDGDEYMRFAEVLAQHRPSPYKFGLFGSLSAFQAVARELLSMGCASGPKRLTIPRFPAPGTRLGGHLSFKYGLNFERGAGIFKDPEESGPSKTAFSIELH